MDEEILETAKSICACGAEDEALLKRLCAASAQALERELREGVAPEDCEGAFICASAWLAAAALTGPLDGVKEQCMEYQRRRDALCGGLRKVGWNAWDSEGTMFTWIPVPEGYTSASCIETLMDTCGVVGTPGTAFGPKGEGYIRFALVRPAEELERICEIIGKNFPMKKG